MSAPLLPVEIEIRGTYCDVPHPKRSIEILCNTELNDEHLMVILYESLCQLRNRLQETNSPEQMHAFAEKFKIFHLGIHPEES